MFALSIDSAASICAAAISDIKSGEVLATCSHNIGRGHAEKMMETIETCLKQADINYQYLDKIISSTGPGSFTGVRIGLSVARGLGLALDIPVVGISTLQACAYHGARNGPDVVENATVSVVLEAHRGEVYFQQFHNDIALNEASVISSDALLREFTESDIASHILCGSGAPKISAYFLENEIDLGAVIAHNLATAPIAAFAKLGMVADQKLSPPEPLYLRSPDAKVQSGFAVSRLG